MTGEAAETQVWLAFASRCGYMQRDEAKELYQAYNDIIRMLVGMINHPETWLINDKAIHEEVEFYGDPF
ncbi:MAG: four helix bundle protein [Roseiflexaceae bacterium]